MNIAILGFGSQGRSAFEYWSSDGHEITICDSNKEIEIPNGAHAKLGSDYLNNLDGFDMLVRSPSVHPRDVVTANTPGILQKMTTNTNEFFRVSPTKKIIGVTGTKGKGTTSTLITKMLEAAGERAHLAGNIGTPPLELLKSDLQMNDWVVLELANFQLIDLQYSPVLAVCLMVVPEHLNWHADFNEYVAAKSQLFAHQTNRDIAVYYAENNTSKQIVSVSAGLKVPYYSEPGAHIENGSIVIEGNEICKTSEIKLLGAHNWQNACAAVTAVWQITRDTEAMKKVLTSFSGMEHRLEFVREKHKVKYYDDSFGTTPETAIVAIEAFKEPKVVILGGSDKGASYSDLANTVAAENVRGVVLIGQEGPKIGQALKAAGYTGEVVDGGSDMKDIVGHAKHIAKHGDIVLLSTGCASFGLFKNYKDRAEKFVKAVKEL